MSVTVQGDLGRRDAVVLKALHFLANSDGQVTVSKPELARALGWTQASGVRHAVRGLEHRGLVLVTNNSASKAPRPCTYTVTALGHEVAEGAERMEAV